MIDPQIAEIDAEGRDHAKMPPDFGKLSRAAAAEPAGVVLAAASCEPGARAGLDLAR